MSEATTKFLIIEDDCPPPRASRLDDHYIVEIPDAFIDAFYKDNDDATDDDLFDAFELGAFDCVDCGLNTLDKNEYYMVHDAIWDIFGAQDGMLCVGCLERRLKRKLKSSDFTDCLLITKDKPRSIRFRRRLAS